MEIKQFIWNVVDSNSWLITEGNKGLLFDAIDNTELYIEINKIQDLSIILSHCHFDHIVGLNKIREKRPDIKVYATTKCSENIGDSKKNTSNTAHVFLQFYLGGLKSDVIIKPFSCAPAENTFLDEMVFFWSGHHIALKSVHGHSSDGLIALIDNKYLFSGDTLLPIPTITKLRTGSTRCFWREDIPMLKGLKVDQVFPGHGKAGQLNEMIRINEKHYKLMQNSKYFCKSTEVSYE